MALLALDDLLAQWQAELTSISKLRTDLSSLEMQKVLGYRDAWLRAGATSLTERNKLADIEVADLASEIVRVRADLEMRLDVIAYLKAAVHHADRAG